ncbi:MAG: dynamin family protein [Microcoleus sp. PH2017_10_PVI_O_A]|uniref:dynamin family protein n=1 Tax=unclassified Microcoleus TaxID=2642155 RepID=UPI001D8B5425|nr:MULTISPECIES: dynamin family protein [unclassified Microcoleus]TAE83022.1 MAG: dynamin [Oscillatoriales cyanobacterium]MCC3406591.1 dynamin family protein [Microcoleus sp. PH2017_10_PVI_O_A]MCC3460604.1 dynamin family protein [Microcoleus sp. PH2017_11_PCY_U_A]MCC3479095.1 dynamin family protein [Microcoleus sp. PH2017_12_PCY_D_A]MCC3559992.1 dynamin family protein [Microcoleus sp. PH2017_27_LUM_O_A]
MDTSLISSQTVEVVLRLTGQNLRKEDINPPILFLAALITVLLGVINADGTFGAEEKQQLVTTLRELIPANNSLQKLVMPMVKSVTQHQVYNKFPVLLALTACFSEEEKLLLISFGYQMSVADGSMDEIEKQYLKNVADRLGIDGRYLTVLEASFSSRAIEDTAALEKVRSLLDPAQFQSLDSMFVRAASHILQHLPAKPKQQKNQKHSVSSYQELKKFQEYRQQLNAVCQPLYLTLQDGSDRNVISPNLTEEVTKISRKLESQCFRVAVVGDFSKGKSTLLNALVGEKIQPVRATPCSGTVTILKYGSKRRVICHYKNGCKEEISPEEYKEKAAISKKAASGSIADKIAKSEIAEIVFEHPELELCSKGVEIIDTPGLNEQAERTLATQQVLKTADAVIFLTNANNVLPQTEEELLFYLKKELNYGKEDEGARNIFIAVNFFDGLETEEDRQDVKERVETIVNGAKPIIAGENRIHFISAKSALEAILDETENEYVKSFQDFTKSLEQFLTVERGAIELQQSAAGIQQIIDTGCQELNQWQKMSEGKLTVSEGDKQKIFEQMAEVSGREVKIKLLANELMEQSLEEALESWHEWVEGLGERLRAKSHRWTSEHGHIMSQDKLTKDYADQFVRDITKEIDDWGNQKVQSILKQNMGVLDSQIGEDIYAIRQEFQQFDQQLSTSLVAQFNNLGTAGSLGGINSSGSRIASSIGEIEDGGFLGGLGIGAAVGAALLFFTGLGFIGVVLGGLAAGAGGGLGWSFLDGDAVKAQIKEKVCELGFEKFGESAESIFEKVQQRIIAVFADRADANSDAMSKAIALWENLLEQQEKRDRQNQAECEAEKAWLADKRRELEQVQNQIETILNRSDR